MDKISIITVCFNASDCIEETIKSVLAQDYPNIEYIIKDGCSRDNTLEIVRKYAAQIDVVESSKDSGIFDAMNQALDKCTGDWVLFMNAGDRFVNKCVLSQLFEKKVDGGVGFVWGYTEFFTAKKLIVEKPVPFYECGKYVKPMGFCHQSVLVRRSLAMQHPFDLSYKVAADYKMIKEIYDSGYLPLFVPVTIAHIDVDGFSANNRLLQYQEIARICGVNKELKYKVLYELKKIKQKLKR